jgi:hypothetical protein
LDTAEIIYLNQEGRRIKSFDASESNDRENLGYAQDISVKNNIIAVTFSKFKSSEKKTTKFTTILWDESTNEYLRKDSGVVGYTDEPMQIKEITKDKTELVVTGSSKFGSNILRVDLGQNEVSNIKYLTKTRSAVTNPIYFMIEDDEYVVWFDIKEDYSNILVASTNKEVVEASYANIDLSLVTMVGNGVMGVFGSFLMVIHAVGIIFMPCIALSFIVFKLQKMFKFNPLYATVFVMIAHVAIKIYYIMVLMVPSKLAIMFEPFFTNDTLVIAVLILTSIISAITAFNFKKHQELDTEHYVYAFFALIDITALMLTYQVYVYSMQMITRL